ncbi:MAG: Mrp/NBP35 family ATP-binding protein [Bacteroidales bacterium]|nr:Mrp/NBP35 family ATP-binding protein [Bacteroidales bacterium]
MSYTSKQIFDALRNVNHPASNKDIVTLGMVNDLKIEGKKISFSLETQKPNDPLINSIKKACVNAILTHVDKDAEIKGNINVKTKETMNDNKILPEVKNIIAIASGKGGVGKSTVATNLAVAFAQKGFKTGLIDADIFGPSIPKMFNTENVKPVARMINGKEMIEPVEKYGVKMLSIGYFIEQDSALVWRGPMASNTFKQLVMQANWGELDYLFVDLPPGTSDIHLTLVQEVHVTGAVIVSTPQKVALADAIKGISMFTGDKINVPVLGLIENMSWFTPAELPDNKYYIFGKDGCKNLAEKYNITLLGQIPLIQSICENSDSGTPSVLEKDNVVSGSFLKIVDNLITQINYRNKNMEPTKKVEITNQEGCNL